MVESPTSEVSRTVARLLSNASPAPFSDSAFARLKEAVDDFIDALTGEAYRIAHRSRADTVSSAHVDEALGHLIAMQSRRVFRHMGTFGGILLGSALSQLVTMLSDARFTPIGVTVTAVLGIIGSFLVALHMAKD
jgi:histone H3/H4